MREFKERIIIQESDDRYIKLVDKRTYQRPYADTKYEYIVVAKGYTRNEVLEYCQNQICRCKYSYTDSRGWWEDYYTFDYNGSSNDDKEEIRYTYTIISPFKD